MPGLRSGEGPQFGMFVKTKSFELAEIIAAAGIDFVIMDTEHALYSTGDLFELLGFYRALGVSPLVRLTHPGDRNGARYLDAGAAGVLVPHVTDAETARRAMAPLAFAPLGERGMGSSSRAGLWGLLEGGKAEYLRQGNEDVARVAMIEDENGLEALADIAGLDLVNALFIGPADLAHDLKARGSDLDPKEAVDDAVSRANELGVPVGTVASDAHRAEELLKLGCSYLLVGNDTGVFVGGLRSRLETFAPLRRPARADQQKG